MRIVLAAAAFFLHIGASLAQPIPVVLHLNNGALLAIDANTLPALSLSPTAIYSQAATFLTATPGDTLLLKYHNHDTIAHSLRLGSQTILGPVPPGDSATALLPAPALGLHILRDPNTEQAYLGAYVLLHVTNSTPDQTFHWDIHAHQRSYNQRISIGQLPDWSTFYPDYFTINGLSYPDTETDATARITGSVGDTIHIAIANTSMAVHSIHFHGYHFRILHSSRSATHTNWIKDSMPIHPFQTMVLELVPDKPGMYPVHDHNLLSLTGAGIYPNGLMQIIEIQ